MYIINLLSGHPAKLSNTLKQLVFSVFDHFVGLALKWLEEQVHGLHGVWDNGKALVDKFSEKRIFFRGMVFHQPIKQKKIS